MSFVRNEKQSIPYYQHEALLAFPEISHAIFCREGGLSSPPYDHLNLGIMTDDPKAHDNITLIKKTFSFPFLKYAKLNHGDTVLHVDRKDFPLGLEGDALITNLYDVPLMVTHADCQALLLYDPVEKAIGCIHSGWKGNILNIYERTLHKMHDAFGSNTSNIIACLSPSLGPKHSYFLNYREEFPDHLWTYKDSEDRINLWDIAKDQLLNAGVKQQNIHFSAFCSWESENFYSHRKERPTGRNASIICLRHP